MAKIHQLITFISKWEGGYVNDPSDPGGPTNKGVTLNSWKNEGFDKNEDGNIDIDDLKLVTHEDMVAVILRPHYWDAWKADQIKNQSIANLVVDWAWCSGKGTIMSVQRILGVPTDGIVGIVTLNALNNYRNQGQLFTLIKNERIRYILSICDKRPMLKRFQKGWLNRIASHNFSTLSLFILLAILLPACRTMASHSEQLVAISTQGIVSEQATVVEEKKQTAELTDQQVQVCQTDILVETMLIAFSYPLEADTTNTNMPMLIKGCAILNRVRKIKHLSDATLATAITSQSQQLTTNTNLFNKKDSQVIESVSKQSKQTNNIPPLILLLLILACLFIIAYLLSNYMRDKSD